MDRLIALNSKEIKEISKEIEDNYGAGFDFSRYGVYKSGKDKVYIINREATALDFDELRVNTLGLYFCDMSGEEIRLSMEGSFLVSKTAKKGILDIGDDDAVLWLSGKDLELKAERGFLIIRNRGDILGSGKSTGRLILNYLPKTRRLKAES